MDKIIKTLHLRLDSTSKSLTKNAISQLIVKILFQDDKPLTLVDISKQVNSILKTSIDENRILEGLEKLLEKKEIKFDKKHYALTKSNRKTLEKRYVQSKERIQRIVQNYFSPFHSQIDNVLEWFSDATVEFFQAYSIEWISDLCYNKSEKLKTKKEDIFAHISRRTKHNKSLSSDDHTNLVDKFIDCIIYRKDDDLDAHLWQYGTSAFAANLLQASIGADPMSINAFRDSKCVLDTNVLMNIGLEASEYHDAIKKLDNIFDKLNITPGYLHITEEEYMSTIQNKRKEILRTAGKFSYDVIKETDDHFLQSAVKRQCHIYEDYVNFCDQIANPPKRLDSIKSIQLFNSDENLELEIQLAQKDEKKKDHLNNIYREITGNDKRERPLIHDVGLLAGIEYIRKSEKAFVLSQEISINSYSHTKPVKDDLPLAIKLETLINMLAIDNGGTDVNPSDFSNLFADMVRFNLHPEKNTFQMADLSRMLDTELQIEQLPAVEVIKIANNLHQNRLKGLPDEEISLSLQREFQDVKLKFISDYEIIYDDLSYEKSEHRKKSTLLSKTEKALKDRIRGEEVSNYDRAVIKNKCVWFIIVPLAITILTCLGIYYFTAMTESSYINYIIGIVINVIFWLLSSLLVTKPKLFKHHESLKLQIEKIVEERFNRETT